MQSAEFDQTLPDLVIGDGWTSEISRGQSIEQYCQFGRGESNGHPGFDMFLTR
jgi:hypothetical protein